MDQLKLDVPKQVQACIVDMKDKVKHELSNELANDLSSMVRDQIEENNERRRRDANIMIFNLPESKADNPDLRKTDDEGSLWEILDVINSPQVDFTSIIRIGIRQPNKTRPLKLILLNPTDRRKIFDACRDNRDKLLHHKVFSNVIITRDYTPKQREENKNLREEVRKRREAGEKVRIRGDKIVTDSNPKATDRKKASNNELPVAPLSQTLDVRRNQQQGSPKLYSSTPRPSSPFVNIRNTKRSSSPLSTPRRIISYKARQDILSDSMATDDETIIYSQEDEGDENEMTHP
ncbi:hypothetical protein SNE40_020903 [Patella caerulea]|uniref:Uncharacterized protein n=1 Tax=Patella caerulea TaxID=87958 RepID=A0AAN8IZR2_PATCE